MTSTNDPLANIIQTQGRNFFSVRAFGADHRISNPKNIFSRESIDEYSMMSHRQGNAKLEYNGVFMPQLCMITGRSVK